VVKIKKIITHVNVDADNVASVLACAMANELPLENILFVPADYNKRSPDEIPVDIKANKHPDGDAAVCSYKDMYPEEFVKSVVHRDNTGRYTDFAIFIDALKAMGWNDFDIVKFFHPVMQGLTILKNKEHKAAEKIKKMKRVKIGRWEFLINEGRHHPLIRKIGPKLGCTGMIYADGNNIGISRFPGKNEPDLSKLNLPGWFTHPGGFLFCWGSLKAPKERKQEEFKNVEEFIEYVKKKVV